MSDHEELPDEEISTLRTRWTYVRLGRTPDDSRYEEAWQYLFSRYHAVIQRYFLRYAGDATTASEMADEFIARWVEGKLDAADPTKGRFRGYLFRCLRNFSINHHHASTRKTGWRRLLPLGRRDTEAGPQDVVDPSQESPEDVFERDYLQQVLTNAMEKLATYQQRQTQRGNKTFSHSLIEALYIEPPSSNEQPSYRDLAARFELSEKAVERQLDYARKKLKEWILSELRDTITTAEELEEEIALFLRHCPGVFDAP